MSIEAVGPAGAVAPVAGEGAERAAGATSPSARSRAKRLAGVAGTVACVLSLVFIGRELARHGPELASWRPGSGEIAAIAALACLHALAMFLLAETWHRIVGAFGHEPRGRTWTAYAVTQIARYLPGNVAHLFGRAAWLRGGALGAGALTKATLVELAVVPLGALAALAPILALLPPSALAALLPWPLPDAIAEAAPPLLACGALAATFAGAVLAGTLLPGAGRGANDLVRGAARLAAPIGFVALFMLWLGGSFALLVLALTQVPLGLALIACILAWLVGYATPGAPGGIGVREAVMVVGLQTAMGPAAAAAGPLVLAVVLHRVVTTLGDAVCFAMGLGLRRLSR